MPEFKPLDPTPASVRRVSFLQRVIQPLLRIFFRPWVKLTTEGLEYLPVGGPALVLANHASTGDPLIVAVAAGLPIHWLATEGLFHNRVMGYLITQLGGLPKRKGTSDIRAVKMMKSWADAGAVVGIFPEGERTWDGRPLPLMPGIDKLIRVLNVPVVTARIYNADRQWPRWAPRPRRSRVHVVFDPPVSYAKKTPGEEILKDLEERLRVIPDGPSAEWPVAGDRLAEGVTNVVFACPRCLKVEGLEERGSRLRCHHCRAEWSVDSRCRLVPRDGSPPMTLGEVADRIRKGLGDVPVADEKRFLEDGVALETDGEVVLQDYTGDTPIIVGKGRLQLTRSELRLQGTDWRLPLDEVLAAFPDVRRLLCFRTRDRLFQPLLPKESVVKWGWFTTRWKEKGRGRGVTSVDRLEGAVRVAEG